MVDEKNKDEKATGEFKPGNAKSSSNEDQPADAERKVDLYNVNDGIHGREGLPYLDQVEQLQQEIVNAAREGRKPNLDEPATYPGIVTVPGATLQNNHNNTLLAGDDRRLSTEIRAIPVAKDVPLVNTDFVDFSVTDDNKGEKAEDVAPILTDNPVEHNTSKAVVAGVTGTETNR